MKTIKVLIAATEELHDEKIQFTSLIEQLNGALRPRGIELERIKWDPETDGSIEDFMAEMHSCEMCLTLYWRELADQSEEELNVAYQSLKDGKNPQNLYVFFKEPTEEVSDALRDFKANFVTNYGHFFCKFENVDTMNLHFILQFEAYQNRLESDGNKLITVSNGKVKVGDKELVDLDNVPFAALNKEYRRLQHELAELDAKIAKTKADYMADSDNADLEEEFITLKSKRKNLAEEFEKYQNHLYDIALNFAKRTGEAISERMMRAKEAFDNGNAVEADNILNMEVMKREAEQEKKQFEQHIENLRLKVEEFRMKADTVMANTELSMPERFEIACEAYQEAIDIAREIHYEEDKLANILFNYAYLLQKFNRMNKATDVYDEVLVIYRRLALSNQEAYDSDVALTLNNLACLQDDLGRYAEAEKNYIEALEIRRRLALSNPEAYASDVAMTLNNLAVLQKALGRYAEAEKNYTEALEIRRRLALSNQEAYDSDVALTLNNLACLQDDLGRYAEAEKNYIEALEIRRRLALSNPEAYDSDVAMTLNNLAGLQYALGRYAEAEKNYTEALEIRRRLALSNPEAYDSDVAMTLNNLAVLQKALGRYTEAEANFTEALEIRRRLALSNPEAYASDVAMTLNNLACLQDDLGRYAEAEKNYTEALEIRRRLALSNPEAYDSDVALTLNNLACLQDDLGRYAEAEKNYIEALEIRRRLALSNPEAYDSDVADTLNNLAILQKALGRYAEAEKNYTEALEIFERLEEKNRGKYADYIQRIKEEINNLKTKHIFIASSAELKQERLELVDLLEDLTQEKYKAQGIKLMSELWEYVDSSMREKRKEDEYLERLKESEICIVLFWKTLGKYTLEELDVAVAEMQAGRKPNKVYMLFKESTEDIAPALSEFKENVSVRYPNVPLEIFDSMDNLRKKVTAILAAIL